MLQHLLGIIAPKATWKHRFVALMEHHPNIDISSMGFPADWRTLEPWRSVGAALPVRLSIAAAQELS
jgi:hypothetical protein